jgi:2-iminobutanoate/2-iminopropanoate deaminase
MKSKVSTDNAPTPIGPYSQGIRAGDLLFVSGQIAIDPTTGNLIQDSIESETHQVLKNIGAILTAAGLSYDHVVSASVYLKDMALFNRMNEVYGTYFAGNVPPSRATVQVAGLPRDVRIEIGVIAHY